MPHYPREIEDGKGVVSEILDCLNRYWVVVVAAEKNVTDLEWVGH